MIAKYALVRRTAKPHEENMVAGDSDNKGVKVYAWSEKLKGYQFLKRFRPDELKVVGSLATLKGVPAIPLFE